MNKPACWWSNDVFLLRTEQVWFFLSFFFFLLSGNQTIVWSFCCPTSCYCLVNRRYLVSTASSSRYSMCHALKMADLQDQQGLHFVMLWPGTKPWLQSQGRHYNNKDTELVQRNMQPINDSFSYENNIVKLLGICIVRSFSNPVTNPVLLIDSGS